MRTVQGVELELGKCTLMPVRTIRSKKAKNEFAYDCGRIGKNEKERIERMNPLTDESIEIIRQARMTKNIFLTCMEENYNKKFIPKMLEHVKPANYG